MQPDGGTPNQIFARTKKVFEPYMSQLVPGIGGEDHITAGRDTGQVTQHLEPNGDPTTPLRGAGPPAAARRHDHYRRQRLIPPRYTTMNVDRLRGFVGIVGNEPAG